MRGRKLGIFEHSDIYFVYMLYTQSDSDVAGKCPRIK
jgi:hypothetical protein